MNAVMTWWAVSLTLLNHPLGNEILGREQLLTFVPIFVATLVWVTRILFIGSIAVAGDHLLHPDKPSKTYSNKSKSYSKTKPTAVRRPAAARSFSAPKPRSASSVSFSANPAKPVQPGNRSRPVPNRTDQPARISRVTRRPATSSPTRPAPVMKAKGRG